MRPAPRHWEHGLVMILPAPAHCGQVRATVKIPAGSGPVRGLCTAGSCWPSTRVPSRIRCTSRRFPDAESGSTSRRPSRLFERDLEVVPEIRAALRPPRRRPPPLKRSPNPNMLPRMSAKSPNSGTPKDRTRRRRRRPISRRHGRSDRRDRAFRLGEDGVRLGALLEFFLRELIARVRSGWNFIASRRYELLISVSLAVLVTSSTS